MRPDGEHIFGSIGDLAFWMRDQCDQDAWLQALFEQCPHIENEPLYGTTPEQWIRAAVAAWEGAKE